MTALEWHGEIGWELWPELVRAQLKQSSGDDITVRFSTIGGDIIKGSDIFNMLADHRRDNPKIKMNLEIKSVAASMGSAIAASLVWDEIMIEPVSMFMIHNPSLFAFGDFRKLESAADFLKRVRVIWAAVYAKKSGNTSQEINEIMNAETWFFGQEIIDAGFADKLNEAAQAADMVNDKVIVMATMKAQYTDMERRQKELNKDERFDEERAVASLRGSSNTKTVSKPKGDINKNAKNEENNVENKQELMKELPAVYGECVQDGINIERDRVKELTAMKVLDEYKGIPEILAVIDKAVAEGKRAEEVQPLIMAAILKIQNDPAKAAAAALESPGNIQGGNEQNAAIKTDRITEV